MASHDGRGRLADHLRDGDRLLVATGASEPPGLLAELLDLTRAAGPRLELVQVLHGASGQVLQAVDAGHRVVLPVPTPQARRVGVQVLPTSMHQLNRAITSGDYRVDGVLLAGQAIGDDVLPLCVDLLPAAFDRARFRAVEVSAGHPPVPAPALSLARCEVARFGDAPPPPLAAVELSPAARRIGEHVADLVADGDVLEIGVGRAVAGVPDALARRGRQVAVHTGLVSDWTRHLIEAGVADVPLACGGDRPVVGTVAMGSADFYRWLDPQGPLRLVGSAHAHDPAHLMGLGRFVAVNAASQVDLGGQVGVPSRAAAWRAVGGLLDFSVAGAYGGASLVAVESVDRSGRSQVVASVGAVQLPGQLVTHVVTEHGVARLANRTWSERARELVAVAHPDHRDQLRRELDRG